MPKISTESDRKSIREHLLEIGKSFLEDKSCLHISVEEAAAQAGIAKGTFYNFFDSKEAYFKAIVDDINEEDRLALEKLFASGTPERQAVRAAVRTAGVPYLRRADFSDFLISGILDLRLNHKLNERRLENRPFFCYYE